MTNPAELIDRVTFELAIPYVPALTPLGWNVTDGDNVPLRFAAFVASVYADLAKPVTCVYGICIATFDAAITRPALSTYIATFDAAVPYKLADTPVAGKRATGNKPLVIFAALVVSFDADAAKPIT